MSQNWHLPWTASCLCGQVKMTISEPPIISTACHCLGCQKLTGGAYSLTLMLPRSGFAVSGPEPVIGGLHGPNKQYYCPHCLSWLFNSIPGADHLINMRATMLDDASWVVPFVDMWTETKLPGVVTGAVRSFERFPPEAQYGGLTADFMRQSARPDY